MAWEKRRSGGTWGRGRAGQTARRQPVLRPICSWRRAELGQCKRSPPLPAAELQRERENRIQGQGWAVARDGLSTDRAVVVEDTSRRTRLGAGTRVSG